MEPLNKSDFCDKRLKYKGFYRKNNLKSETSYIVAKKRGKCKRVGVNFDIFAYSYKAFIRNAGICVFSA